MRYILLLILWLYPIATLAREWEERRLFESAETVNTLRVLSSTDTVFLAPVISEFVRTHPNWSVEYLVTGTSEVDRLVRSASEDFDIVISSAMDLQLKLVNDGHALSLDGLEHPDWAEWRDSLFAFTSEPATIVINRQAFADTPLPNSRQDLIKVLRDRSEEFQGKLGTYDVRQSGLGYLFATQDARVTETYWRLMEVMGALDARLYCCSGEMIDDVASGEILVAYNVLGSYAAARKSQDDRLEIIRPSDFPTLMMRTIFVTQTSIHQDAAARFLRFLLAIQTEEPASPLRVLPPLTANQTGSAGTIIPLDPSLMTYQDRLKRRKFLKEWESAIIQ